MLEPLLSPWVLLGLFVLLAYTTEAMTGFGSIVIALSLGALVLPLDTLMPVLVPLNLLLSGGYLARPWLGQTLLQTLFGVLIAVFSVRELWRLRHGPAPARPHGAGWGRVWMLLAGVTHGLYASGGPLLVYALSGVTLDKSRFRATLIMVWFTLNGLLTLGYAAQGALQPVWPQLAALAPVVLAGIVLGEILHHRVDEHRFRQVLFSVLLLAGLALVF